MTPTKTVFLLALVGALLPSTAHAEYRYLCTSVPSACEYTDQFAPLLIVDVCYHKTTAVVRLKGTAPCPVGTSPYTVKHGEVIDPTLGLVAAYSPLDNACDHGLCLDYTPHDGGTENVMCCENGGPCWPGGACGGILYWCHDGVTNGDGTIGCFDAEPL